MEDITVVEVAPPGVQVAYIMGDSAPSPVYVPGTATSGDGVLFDLEFTQEIPQSVWTVPHPPGVPISWSLRTSSGDLAWNYVVEPQSTTQLRVSMDDPTAGTIQILMRRTV